ncbi:hypothetical protein [Mobilicoccus caccae]|uniref:Peptidase MA superfamily protein n=1 Tax=Mobilicoccus caccae TaxID=1859295 RepID=A0ABQ6IN59_9MICO|nr:hypothetical protein [Mobilicoccus caccae]GMA38148.1 hypothetical protein GCM10025883_01930 [Mobilicoccus caccae]
MRPLRIAAALALSASISVAPALAPAGYAATAWQQASAQVATAPIDPEALRARIAELMPTTESPRKAALDRLMDHPQHIDGSQYQCGPTQFNRWAAQATADFTAQDRQILDSLAAYDLPTYEALVFGAQGHPDFALRADAKDLEKTMRKLRSFWDIKHDDIQLMAMHGEMLADPARTARVYEVVYEVPRAQAQELARLLAEFIRSDPKFEGGNHPIFTLNAFAFTTHGQELPGLGRIGDRIVMGDGILQAYRELGYGDVAPEAILAHEYAHHVQFEIGMIPPNRISTPEGTRRTELHADASAAYFLSHPRGLSMQQKRVTQFLTVFYTIGDCSFASTGHHGTPLQRERAANWAYQVQEQARPKGKILTTRQFFELFEAELPRLIAPDARVA